MSDLTCPTDVASASDFLVEFTLKVPAGTPESEVEERQRAEAIVAADLARRGRLRRVWKRPGASGDATILGLYRAGSKKALDDVLAGLPLYEWMTVTVTPLDPHPNDPTAARHDTDRGELPGPDLSLVYRLEATVGRPLDLGRTAQGHRRIVPLSGGTFAGPALNGRLVPGASADWQVVLPDGTALGDIRYTLETDGGDFLDVRSRGVRHGSPDVLARLGRGDDVDPREYTFRTSTQIETASPDLDWLNKGVFVGVGGRQAAGVAYETYLVG